jgi:hypothetical protein
MRIKNAPKAIEKECTTVALFSGSMNAKNKLTIRPVDRPNGSSVKNAQSPNAINERPNKKPPLITTFTASSTDLDQEITLFLLALLNIWCHGTGLTVLTAIPFLWEK